MSTIDDAIRAGCRAGCLWAVCDYPDCQPGACETYLEHTEVAVKAALAVERTACAAIAREFCQIGDSDILREGDARRIYERILARGEVTK